MPSARAATTLTITITGGSPSPNPANINAGDKVKWHNNDLVEHKIMLMAPTSPPSRPAAIPIRATDSTPAPTTTR